MVGLTAGLLVYLLADDEAVNLAMHEMMIAGLWHGKALGVTIAWLSVFVSAVVFLVARR